MICEVFKSILGFRSLIPCFVQNGSNSRYQKNLVQTATARNDFLTPFDSFDLFIPPRVTYLRTGQDKTLFFLSQLFYSL